MDKNYPEKSMEGYGPLWNFWDGPRAASQQSEYPEENGFLFYDNLVRGAGVGHCLTSYNHGLIMAMDNNMTYLPEPLVCGHNLGRDGLFEFAMGLPDCAGARKVVRRRMPDRITEVKYNPAVARCTLNNDFSRTKEYFNNCYKNRGLVFKTSMVPNKINICINIRRGDILLVDEIKSNEAVTKRILPDNYYIRALDFIIKKNSLAKGSYHVHVFSDGDQGVSEDNGGNANYINEHGKVTDVKNLFEKYGLENVSFTIGEDTKTIYKTIQACSESDIFIASNSGFSSAISLYLKEDSLTILPDQYSFHPYHAPNYIKFHTDEKKHLKYYFKK
tara:strand:- start:83937 stop:84929 length:993 start_codon:yes stop_codon:yes gene_type:complete